MQGFSATGIVSGCNATAVCGNSVARQANKPMHGLKWRAKMCMRGFPWRTVQSGLFETHMDLFERA